MKSSSDPVSASISAVLENAWGELRAAYETCELEKVERIMERIHRLQRAKYYRRITIKILAPVLGGR